MPGQVFGPMKKKRTLKPGHWMLFIVLGTLIVSAGLYHHQLVALFVGAFIAAYGWGMLEQ